MLAAECKDAVVHVGGYLCTNLKPFDILELATCIFHTGVP